MGLKVCVHVTSRPIQELRTNPEVHLEAVWTETCLFLSFTFAVTFRALIFGGKLINGEFIGLWRK